MYTHTPRIYIHNLTQNLLVNPQHLNFFSSLLCIYVIIVIHIHYYYLKYTLFLNNDTS